MPHHVWSLSVSEVKPLPVAVADSIPLPPPLLSDPALRRSHLPMRCRALCRPIRRRLASYFVTVHQHYQPIFCKLNGTGQNRLVGPMAQKRVD